MPCGSSAAAANALDPGRAVPRQFWQLNATGIASAESALMVGASVPVGDRWSHRAGGLPPI